MLTGEKRMNADRMWRSAAERKRFEAETGLRPLAPDDDGTMYIETYNRRFIEWAAEQIAAQNH